MPDLIIDRKQILPDNFPQPKISDIWIEAWYQMHEEIWWKTLGILEIPDWFVDTNGTLSLGKNWQIYVPEVDTWIAVVNKKEDPLLHYCLDTLVPHIRWLESISLQIKKLSAFINFIWINPGFIDSTNEEKPLLLWEVFKKQWAVCRHKSLIFKIICDELWIESWIRGWFVIQDWDYTRHLWNEVYIDWEWFVVDNAYQKEKWAFKYGDVENTYCIRDWKKFTHLVDIWEWNKE